jgi:hypothetical protein
MVKNNLSISNSERKQFFIFVCKLLLFFPLIAILIFSSPFFIPDEQRPLPSQMFTSNEWSTRYWQYKNSGERADYLIVGNSRSLYALNPFLLGTYLNNKKDNHSYKIVSLATYSGFFPFYLELFRQLIPDELLPRLLILCLSPRDFDLNDIRSNDLYNSLVNSPAYKFHIKKRSFVESRGEDVFSLIIPQLYYKSDWSDLTNFKLKLKDITFRKYFDNFPKWLSRFNLLFGLNSAQNYSENDWNPQYRDKEHFSVEKNKKAMLDWLEKRKSQEYLKLLDLEKFVFDKRENSEQAQLFSYLEKKGVKTILVVLPAIKLEGAENHPVVYNQFKQQLLEIKASHGNIIDVYDLNNNFNNPYLNPDYFLDGEHVTELGMKILSSKIAEYLATISNQND